MKQEQTYVLGETEVKMTGRSAEKSPATAGGKKIVVVEVTPANEFDGTWKKWVNPAGLFSIIEDSK